MVVVSTASSPALVPGGRDSVRDELEFEPEVVPTRSAVACA